MIEWLAVLLLSGLPLLLYGIARFAPSLGVYLALHSNSLFVRRLALRLIPETKMASSNDPPPGRIYDLEQVAFYRIPVEPAPRWSAADEAEDYVRQYWKQCDEREQRGDLR